ncbi:pre-toxin TG domain-containing protein [Sporosarcina sp. ANT_H38]|nr:pre-toxin TG domain-containing protein [Sporosarcina sp. ANT_H38]
MKETLSAVADFIPVVGNVKAIVEVVTGRFGAHGHA